MTDLGWWVLDPDAEPLDLSGGELTADGLRWMQDLEVTFCVPNPVVLYVITGGALGCYPGRPRPLAMNGHEYRRRVRRR